MTAVRVATLNIRHFADRWAERLPLILADMASVRPDLLGLQEVVFPMEQDRIIAAGGGRRYRIERGWAGRPEYGNSLLVSEDLPADDPERLELGAQRSAFRARVAVSGSDTILFSVTHLHHVPADEGFRDEQAAALVAWLDAAPSATAQVVVGDFNAEPDEPTYARMSTAGFRSASLVANGDEPAVTWPSGLQAPGIDTDGEPGCLDYIWVRGAVEVASARLAFDRPAVGDPTLYPSDHLGLVADLRIG